MFTDMNDHSAPPSPPAGDPAASGAGASDAAGASGRRFRLRPRTVIAVVIVAALVIFMVQNRSQVPVSFLVIEVHWPLWVVIVTAAAAGAVVREVLRWVIRLARRRRRHDRRL